MRKQESRSDKTRVNEMIRAPKVRVIAEDGEQLGIMRPAEAIDAARERGLDLVEVAGQADPPVCRIMDYGKYMYQQKKRAHEARRHQKIIQIKEVKFRPKIDEHDYAFKKNHILRFIEAGHHVKVVIMFRGREIVHKDLGRKILDRVVEEMEGLVRVDREPDMEGRTMTMVLSPKKD